MDPPKAELGAKKKRRRIHLNCEECRRTKSKCNRSWPCSECVKKGLAHICPNQVSKVTQPKSVTIAELTARVSQLEDTLRKHGLENEIGDCASADDDEQVTRRPSFVFSSGPSSSITDPTTTGTSGSGGNSVVLTESGMDMAAMLGRLALGHEQTKRYAGMGTTAFYLSSPSASEDEEGSDNEGGEHLGRSRRVDAELWRPPWGRTRGVSLTGRGHLPGVLLDRCRAMLCSRRAAKEMFDKFFEMTSWRIQPMTPAFFDTVLASVYDSPEGAHPHDLAVLFAVQAMTMLFDPTAAGAAPEFHAVDYHQTAYSCLVAGNFYTETTLSSLVCLHLLGSFIINSDDKRLIDGIFTIVGLGVKLAVIAGYHRDAAPAHLTTEQIDWRRRIWHELLALERVHCLTALIPGSIDVRHYDTPYPTDAHRDGYFVHKWNLGLHMSRVFGFWCTVGQTEYSGVKDIDAGLRRFLHDLPPHLRCAHFPVEAFPLTRPGAPTVVVSPAPVPSPSLATSSDYPSTVSPERLTHQQYRMATHICMVFFYLHRPCFMRAILTGSQSGELSLATVIEVCERMLDLVRGILSQDQSMTRWFSFAADLFSVLLCQAVLVGRTSDPALAQNRMSILDQGLAVLEWTALARPNSKNRALVQRTRRLVTKARESLARFPLTGGLPLPGSAPVTSTLDFLPAVEPSVVMAPMTVAPMPIPTPSASEVPQGITIPPVLSTPSDASGSMPQFASFDLNDALGYPLPPVPSANDVQFEAWLAVLFDQPDGGGVEATATDVNMDPNDAHANQAPADAACEALFLQDPDTWAVQWGAAGST